MHVRVTVDVDVDECDPRLLAVLHSIGTPDQVVLKDLQTVLADVSYLHNVRVTCVERLGV